MGNIQKNLERRLARLEQRLCPPFNPRLVWVRSLDQAGSDGGAPTERIVEDYYDNAAGETVVIMKRIPSDPSDVGWRYRYCARTRKILAEFEGLPRIIERVCWKKRPPPFHGERRPPTEPDLIDDVESTS